MTLRRTFARSWVLVLLVNAACSGPSEDASAEASAALTESATDSLLGVDCRAACPGKSHAREIIGVGLSGERVAALEFRQSPTCTVASDDYVSPYRVKQAGDSCRFRSTEDDLGYSSTCPEFLCGETGTFRAAACIGPRAKTAGDGTHLKFRCANREEACAAALEAASQFDVPLCR